METLSVMIAVIVNVKSRAEENRRAFEAMLFFFSMQTSTRVDVYTTCALHMQQLQK